MAELGLWSCVVEPGKGLPLDTPAAVRITNVALGDKIKDSAARTTLKLTYTKVTPDEDEESDENPEPTLASTFICALTPGKIEQFTTNIVLEEQEEYLLEVVGPNTLYLTGNYIDTRADMPPYDDSDMDSDEEAFDLRDVSSDVEMDPEDLDAEARFEEIDEAVHGSPANLKRTRESDAGAEVAKLSKKQKTEAGKPAKPAALEAGEKKEKKKGKKEKEPADKADGEKPAKKPTATEHELAGGLKYKDSKVGTGPAAKKGNTVSMRYIGKLQNGRVFDSNTKGKPFTFHLGKGEVIKGWDEGIVGMQVGCERVLTIPAAMAYGKRGTEGIPPNSTLTFEVKLTDLK